MKTIVTNSILLELLSNNITPFYFYNKNILRETIRELQQAFQIEDFQLLFATMANDNAEFLTTVKEMQVGACINSIKHFELVRSCGFTIDRIQFTSTGLSKDDMMLLFQNRITINFDSLAQLEQWFSIDNNLSAGIRINTESLTDSSNQKDRLGIEKVELRDAIEIAKKNKGYLKGIHIYIGTNYKSHKEMLPPLIEFFELACKVPDLEYVNIGGGIGVNYLDDIEEFNLIEYGENIRSHILNVRKKKGRKIRLYFEPGRKLAASSGSFLTKITDIKSLNKKRYIVVDGSVAVFPRPLHHPDSPHQVIVPFKSCVNENLEECIIVGKTTFSNDILSRTCLPKNLDIGDILIFEKAGAYCDSMRSRFLGQYEPKNIFLDV